MSVFLRVAAVACAAAAAVGCGKKGPPLAPIVRIPAPVEQITARRVGSDVYVTLTVPAINIDQTTPADIERIEVYGYTGRMPPPRAQWVELSTLVATVPVAPPPLPLGEEGGDEESEPPPTADEPPLGASQGGFVTVRDTLTADELVEGKLPRPTRQRRPPPAAAPEAETVERPLRRFYMAIGFGPRNRPGPPGAAAELPVIPLPDPPQRVEVGYTQAAATITWEPSGGILGFLLDRPLPPEPLPVLDFDAPRAAVPAAATAEIPRLPPGPTLYNVYLTLQPDPLAPPEAVEPAEPWNAVPPAPVNPAPIAGLALSDTLEFERQRCYTVRAVRGTGAGAIESEPAPLRCVTPIDVFPPAPPQSLAAVASEGVISLIWEPNTELDLGGYVVLRGEAGGATLQPLTPTPLTDARYRDEAVKPGVRYVYAVIAVDNRLPVPNWSAASNRVDEVAR